MFDKRVLHRRLPALALLQPERRPPRRLHDAARVRGALPEFVARVVVDRDGRALDGLRVGERGDEEEVLVRRELRRQSESGHLREGDANARVALMLIAKVHTDQAAVVAIEQRVEGERDVGRAVAVDGERHAAARGDGLRLLVVFREGAVPVAVVVRGQLADQVGGREALEADVHGIDVGHAQRHRALAVGLDDEEAGRHA